MPLFFNAPSVGEIAALSHEVTLRQGTTLKVVLKK